MQKKDSEARAEGRKRAGELKRSLGIPSPLRAIRDKCLECCCGCQAEVRRCHLDDCPNWVFRFGRMLKQDELKVIEYDAENNPVSQRKFRTYLGRTEQAA